MRVRSPKRDASPRRHRLRRTSTWLAMWAALSLLAPIISSPLVANAQSASEPVNIAQVIADLRIARERDATLVIELADLATQTANARIALTKAQDAQRDAQTSTRAAKSRTTQLSVLGWMNGSALATDNLSGLTPEPVRAEELWRGALTTRLTQLDQFREAQVKADRAVSDASAQVTVLRSQRDTKANELTATRQQIDKLLTDLATTLSVPVGSLGIPRAALESYVHAATIINSEQPGCDLPWWLLAGIGKVESNHGRGNYLADGRVDPPIFGIALDGTRSLAIADSDDGVYDGDPVWDRAVGPMQFIPGTWNTSGRDANGDGVRDPQNMFDASLASSGYLCRAGLRAGGNLSTNVEAQLAALWSYNPNESYDDKVIGFATLYSQVGLPSGFTILTPLPGAPS